MNKFLLGGLMNISKIYPNDKRSLKLIDELLAKEESRKDCNVD